MPLHKAKTGGTSYVLDDTGNPGAGATPLQTDGRTGAGAYAHPAQRMLRRLVLLETACFCALLIRRMILAVHGYWRAGIAGLDWKKTARTSPAVSGSPTGQYAWRSFYLEHALSDARHTVTRCLKVKRFTAPEVLEAPFDPASTWLLATDGYWVDQLTGQQRPHLPMIEACSVRSLGDAAACLGR